MYTFTNHFIAGLKVSSTIAKQGTQHHKVYTEQGVSPQNQNTLNVYVSGLFNISSGNWSQQVLPGNCSLDLTISEYLKDQVVIEQVESAWASRFCVSCDNETWTRQLYNLTEQNSLTVSADSLLIVLEGELLVADVPMKAISYRLAAKNCQITATTSARIILCQTSSTV